MIYICSKLIYLWGYIVSVANIGVIYSLRSVTINGMTPFIRCFGLENGQKTNYYQNKINTSPKLRNDKSACRTYIVTTVILFNDYESTTTTTVTPLYIIN